MLGSIKDTFQTIQEGISASVKQLSGTEECNGRQLRAAAGEELLDYYQGSWEGIHVAGEQAARQADRCDRLVSQVHAEYEKQWRHVSMLSSLLAQVPEINGQIERAMRCLGDLESVFSEAEVSLLALEETIDARDAQERQLEQRFQLAIYQERRRQELEEMAAKLDLQHQRRRKEEEMRSTIVSRDRQAVFQEQFEYDIKEYKTRGLLQVPSRRPTDVSLESIDLNEDDSTLETFLREDCPDLSPLPRDEVPVVKDVSLEDDEADCATPRADEVNLYVIADTPSPTSSVDGGSVEGELSAVGSLAPSGMTSREESIYFTPDQTSEALNAESK